MAATINYFKSGDVKVFPCAYRGYSEGSNAEAIDPSARSFNEYNFSNIYSNISASKPSYIISYNTEDVTNTVLKCVVGGYYFEISNVQNYISNGFRWLGIKLSQVNNTLDNNDSKSRVLIPVGSTNVDYLDTRGENGSFLGLSYSPEKDTSCDYTLQVFDASEQIYEKSKRLEDSFGHGTGKYSLYSSDNENASEASGFHSIALGKNNTVNHDYSAAIGKNLTTSADFQVLLGEGYTEYTPESDENVAIQMVKAGTDKTENIISISKSGDIKTDNFEVVDGNLVATGNANIGEDLVKINKAVEADQEHSIEAANAKVEINCDTSINGKLKVTGETSINNKLIVDDNVSLADELLKVTKADDEQSAKVEINCDTDITGITNITGNTTITGTTTSTDLITGNNGLTITAGNTSLKNTAISGTLTTTGKLTIGEENAVASADIYGNTVVYGKLTSTNGVNLQNGTTKVITHTIENAGTDNEKSITTLEADTIKLNGEIETENLKLNKINFEDKAELKVTSFEGKNLTPNTQTEGSTIKNNNALTNLQGGLHLGGMITIYSNKQTPSEMLYTGLAIYDSSEQQENANLVAKLKTDGTAYFSQKLIVGGGKEDINISTSGSGADDIADYPSKLATQGGWLWSDINRTIVKDKFAVGGDTYVGGNISTSASSRMEIGQVIKLNPDNNNSIIAIAYNTPSDIRRKQNITDFESKKSLLDLDVKEFEYIDDTNHKKHIGCIAQELQEICPEIVYEDADGYLSIEENKLVYLLLNEVKKLKKEVEELKGE